MRRRHDAYPGILRADARFAREVAAAEVRRMEREHPLVEVDHASA